MQTASSQTRSRDAQGSRCSDIPVFLVLDGRQLREVRQTEQTEADLRVQGPRFTTGTDTIGNIAT